LARELDHAFSLTDILCFGGCVFNMMRRDVQALKVYAEDQAHLAREMSFVSFESTGVCYTGHALAQLGQVQEGMALIREGLAIRKTLGTGCYKSGILGALAEAQAAAGQLDEALATLAEALDFVEETDERYSEAELHRLRADLLLLQGEEAEAEASLLEAIEVARRQKAKSWELRAATQLAHLWQRRDQAQKARQLLAPIFGWFTEGFDTSDLKAAAALLAELET
jgi:predicted ATPase